MTGTQLETSQTVCIKHSGGGEIAVVGSETRNCYPQGQINKMMIITHFHFFSNAVEQNKANLTVGDC